MRFDKSFSSFELGIIAVTTFFQNYEPQISLDLQELVRNYIKQPEVEASIADLVTRKSNRYKMKTSPEFTLTIENRISFGWNTTQVKQLNQYQVNSTPYTFFIETIQRNYRLLLQEQGWKHETT